MRPRLIVIDGNSYQSVNEMPDDIRRQYEQALSTLEDQNGNRIPDALEDNDTNGIRDVLGNGEGIPILKSSIKVLVDGQEYNSLDELPPEVRARYDQAIGALDANRNGFPDFLEGTVNAGQASVAATSVPANEAASRPPRQAISMTRDVTPDTTNGMMLTLAGLLLILLCAAGAAGVWYFIFR